MRSLSRTTAVATFLVAALVSLGLASGTPKKISYQGRVTDLSGNPVADGNYSCTFVLYDHPSLGTSRWSEMAIVATIGGLYTHLLGSNAPLPDSLFAVYDSLYLQVYFSGQTISPRTPVVSSGYALRVNTIDGAKGGYINGGTYWMDTTADKIFGVMRPDLSGNGAGYLEVRKDGSALGIVLEGNYSGSGQPYVALNGSDRDVAFITSIAGSSGVLLPADAIEASEMLDEPGVGSCNNTGIALTLAPQYLCGRTMFAPVNGYVLVTATAYTTIRHTSGLQSNCIFGVSDNMSTYVSSATSRITLASSMPTGNYQFPMMSHSLFPITAGSQAYYVLGSLTGSTSADVYNVQLTECFFPTAYTTVSDPVPPQETATKLPATISPEQEFLEAQAFHIARIQKEQNRMKAELDAVRQEMNDLKNGDESKR